MSFSKDVRQELCSAAVPGESFRHSLVYGMLLFSRTFSESSITLTTESHPTAQLYSEQLSVLTSAIVDMRVNLTHRGGENAVYSLSVPDERDCRRIFDYFGHSPSAASLRINRSNIEDEDCAACFLRGAFLVCGYVTDPEKDYHLEFVVPKMNLANDLCRLIGEIEVLETEPKVARRKGSYIVYLKDCDSIGDLLGYIGAGNACLEVLNQKVYRSLRNKVNRQINSETANSNKTAKAAAKQLLAIEHIRKTKGLSWLPEELRQLAQLRIENPEYNLRELGEASEPPISRSGVNHRLARIIELAKEIT